MTDGLLHDDVCVVVPMFNEAGSVARVVSDLRAAFGLVVCVDDGSSDDSAAIAAAAGAVVLRHSINRGQGAALQTGFDFAQRRGDLNYVVTFDADGQHQADDAARMVTQARDGRLDVVLGTRGRERPEGQTSSRRHLLRLALCFSRLTSGLELTDTHNGLRVLSARSLPLLRLRQRGMAYASELEFLIGRHGLAWAEHPVTIVYSDYSRAKGQRNSNSVNILIDLVYARLESRWSSSSS